MPLNKIKIIFRPTQSIKNSQIRKLGAVLSSFCLFIIVFVYNFGFGVFVTFSPSTQPLVLITLLIFVFLFVVGVHRLIWGNTSNDPISTSWGKGILSVITGMATIMAASIFLGFIIIFILDKFV